MKGLKDKRLRFDKQFEDYNCKTNGEIKKPKKELKSSALFWTGIIHLVRKKNFAKS